MVALQDINAAAVIWGRLVGYTGSRACLPVEGGWTHRGVENTSHMTTLPNKCGIACARVFPSQVEHCRIARPKTVYH